MTAIQVIAVIDRLPPHEKEVVILHVHELEQAMIPDSLLQSMQDDSRGELIEMDAEQFLQSD